ncbi:MAG TPA: DUF2846 domain-containing protein [Verrucomicrobiae bacterium]|nr:DUF2846 domain-containing protein [Verrucomicrobiae bacterium]
MKTTSILISGLGALLVTGCASTRQFVPLPDQAQRIQDASKGRIYVMRPAGVGTAISMNVSDSGKPIGSTGAHGYLCWEREPGDTIITSTSEGASKAPLSVQPGSVHYIFQHVRMGLLMARSELEVLDEQKGLKILKKCHPPKVEPPPPSAVAASVETIEKK